MVGKYLDICTSHLTPDTVDNLTIGFYIGVPVIDYEEGLFVTVTDEFGENPLPDDLFTLLRYAKQNGITLIRLDRDGEEIDGLPTYDWKSPKDKFLEQPQQVQENALMETAMRLQDIADFLRYTGDISIGCPLLEQLQIFSEMAREFEYKYYETDRYRDDYLNFTDEVFRKELKEKFGKEQ